MCRATWPLVAARLLVLLLWRQLLAIRIWRLLWLLMLLMRR